LAGIKGGKRKKTKKGGLEMGIAAGIKDITQDIVSSYDARVADYDARVAEVKRLKKGANEMLDSFKASQGKMGAQLRKDLAQDKAEMEAEVKAMQKGFQASHKKMGAKLEKELIQGVTALRSDVKGMLKDFGSSHKQMGAQLRKELADYNRGIESEVAGMRQETKTDLKRARTTWQGLAHTMEAKRAGVKVPPKVEVPDLEAKLLAAVNKHPKGVSLAEVAQSLDVVPVVLGRASSSLLKKGLIRKKEKLYFPVAGE
jgi:ElaB/YqjD/DUF883 family membrane-anchored ribosome-binding protein